MSRGGIDSSINDYIASSCTSSSEMTGFERKSAFIPVPPSATSSYTSSFNLETDFLKLRQERDLNYPTTPYFGHLQHHPSVSSLAIHPYLPTSHTSTSEIHNNDVIETPPTFQQASQPSNYIESFHPNFPKLQPNNNKVLVKVSDSTMVMADVKSIIDNPPKTRNKRKIDYTSSLDKNLLPLNITNSHPSIKSDARKKRKTKSRSATSNKRSQNNNNTSISIKEDCDEDWNISNDDEMQTDMDIKSSPGSSFSPSKVSFRPHFRILNMYCLRYDCCILLLQHIPALHYRCQNLCQNK